MKWNWHCAENSEVYHIAVFTVDENGQEAERVADFYRESDLDMVMWLVALHNENL